MVRLIFCVFFAIFTTFLQSEFEVFLTKFGISLQLALLAKENATGC